MKKTRESNMGCSDVLTHQHLISFLPADAFPACWRSFHQESVATNWPWETSAEWRDSLKTENAGRRSTPAHCPAPRCSVAWPASWHTRHGHAAVTWRRRSPALPQSIDYLDAAVSLSQVARPMTRRIITNDADKVNTMQAFGGAGRPRRATGHHLPLSASVAKGG